MIKIFRLAVIGVLVLSLCSSCAKDKGMSGREMQNELLDAYMTVTYGTNKTAWPPTTSMGYYYILHRAGTGATLVDGNWLKYDVIPRFQDGTINYSYATLAATAKQLGLFLDTVHYVPNYTYLDESNTFIPQGVQDAMKTLMKEGDSIRLVLVPDLAGSYRSGDWTPVIVDIVLRNVIPNPLDFEQNEVLAFRDAHYPGLDSVKYNFFLKQLEPPTGADELVDGDTAKVFYVGRYMDGFVFNTNVLDTAKKYKYNTKVTSAFDTLSYVIGSSASLSSVPYSAFNEAAKNMKEGERAVIFFTSDWGYGYEGNGAIQSYTPLLFEIWMAGVGKKETTE